VQSTPPIFPRPWLAEYSDLLLHLGVVIALIGCACLGFIVFKLIEVLSDGAPILTSDQLEKQLEESQALFKISQMLAGTIDLQPTLQQIADAATALIKKSGANDASYSG